MTRFIFAVLLAASAALPLAAQGRFDPVVRVGDAVVTRWELDQRTLFLTLLRAPGDVRQLAREQLVNERLQVAAAREAGITATPEAVRAGIEEFAARANLSGDEFLQALAQNGVAAETFRDFITAGVLWRDFVRARFGEEARLIPPAVIRRELLESGTDGGVRLLLTEIILPAGDPATRAASRARAAELAAISDPEAFAEAARVFSIAESTVRGGDVGWRALDALPPPVRAAVANLPEGRTTRPVEGPETIAIYHLRERQTVPAGPPRAVEVDYALFVAADMTEAAVVSAQIDVCDDLYGVARGLAPERLLRETTTEARLPGDIRAALAGLDENETSLAVSRGGRPAVLMLCERRSADQNLVDVEIIGNRLLNQRLGTRASAFLSDLRARTPIEFLD